MLRLETNRKVGFLLTKLGFGKEGIAEQEKSASSFEFTSEGRNLSLISDGNKKLAIAMALKCGNEKTASDSFKIDKAAFAESLTERFEKLGSALSEGFYNNDDEINAIKIAYLSILENVESNDKKASMNGLLTLDSQFLNNRVLSYDFFDESRDKTAEVGDPASVFANSIIKKNIADKIRNEFGEEFLDEAAEDPYNFYNALPDPYKQQIDSLTAEDGMPSQEMPQQQEMIPQQDATQQMPEEQAQMQQQPKIAKTLQEMLTSMTGEGEESVTNNIDEEAGIESEDANKGDKTPEEAAGLPSAINDVEDIKDRVEGIQEAVDAEGSEKGNSNQTVEKIEDQQKVSQQVDASGMPAPTPEEEQMMAQQQMSQDPNAQQMPQQMSQDPNAQPQGGPFFQQASRMFGTRIM